MARCSVRDVGEEWSCLELAAGQTKVANGLTTALFAGVAFMTHQGYALYSAFMTTVGYSWLALFYTACLLIAVTASAGGIARRVLCSPALAGLGSLAYCSYLIHAPMIQAARRLLELRFSPPSGLAIGRNVRHRLDPRGCCAVVEISSRNHFCGEVIGTPTSAGTSRTFFFGNHPRSLLAFHSGGCSGGGRKSRGIA